MQTESTPAPGKRRVYSAAEKPRIVRAAEACRERGEVGALLRREGIPSSLLAKWRHALFASEPGGLGAKRGRKPVCDAKDRRIQELEKKAARLEKDLHVARELIELQKKVSALLGMTLPNEGEL